ncbi:MAG TPA: 4Fe-4S dicluster domain-containing protein, partial [Candidatus Glassbacteria bacterium]|nr:4Fe-4S dicluster domain-containing protein [Candidatus Glassbacteria bacterium]
ATRMGERRDLLDIARARIARHPEKYVPKVYGERDAGGTSVLMLSSIPFELLGFPGDLSQEPLPELTWQVLSKIPSIVLTGGVLLGGLSWIINRRIQIESGELKDDQMSGNGPQGGGR